MGVYSTLFATFVLAGTTLSLVACGEQTSTLPTAEPGNEAIASVDAEVIQPFDLIETATAEMYPASGSDVRGTVVFTADENGVRIEAHLEGLSSGAHGFHIHEIGDCSADDASSAGGHFSPDASPHGGLSASEGQRHAGDFGNVDANAEGEAEFEHVDTVISFTGENSIVGRAVVVHQGEDDLTSQPSGAAGPRVSCGVIDADI